MAILRLGTLIPRVAGGVFVADNATVIGDVAIAERSSVWFGAVVRADNVPIRIGRGSNIQDQAVLHGSPGCPLTLGDYVTVGHGAKLHGCFIGDCCLIGIGAVILDRVEIGRGSIVGAGSVVLQDQRFPPGSLIVGNPAQIKKTLPGERAAHLREHAERYIRDARMYAQALAEAVPGR
jgi:carbonic anhydrase/acetyltransferase-like protein (isoleucine patch superfamily)